MDGEQVSPDEEAKLKEVYAADPDKIIPPKEYSPIRKSLKSTYHSDKDIPNSENFQNSLLEKIESEGGRKIIKATQEEVEEKVSSIEEAREEVYPETKKVEHISTYRKRKSNWFLTAAGMAACFLIGLLINLKTNKAEPQNIVNDTPHVEDHQPVFYSPSDAITADYLSNGETNVIIIQGLDAIPDDIDLFSLVEEVQRKPIKVYPNTTPIYEN